MFRSIFVIILVHCLHVHINYYSMLHRLPELHAPWLVRQDQGRRLLLLQAEQQTLAEEQQTLAQEQKTLVEARGRTVLFFKLVKGRLDNSPLCLICGVIFKTSIILERREY